MALSEIKKKLGDNIAGKFHETIEEAYTGTHLKILWIGRRTQKEAVRQMRRNATISLHVYDFASFVLMNKRRIHSILTTKSGFNELGLKVIPQLGE
ncbi:MAG: hypothetical protein GWN16_03685 [Calditrichae bacterium]|nr:hypothetical protein [Calditrichia bacterium]